MIKGIIVIFAAIVGILLIRYTAHAITLSKRTTYSSEEEMKTALQGTYTSYFTYGNSKSPRCSITINGNEFTYSWPSLDNTIEGEIREWNYKEGTIRTFEELVITSEGNLKDGETVIATGPLRRHRRQVVHDPATLMKALIRRCILRLIGYNPIHPIRYVPEA